MVCSFLRLSEEIELLRRYTEGTPQGSHIDLFGLNTYVTGTEGPRVVVIITDIYGHKFNNLLLIADEFARQGYYVLIPDILNGEDYVPSLGELPEWLSRHGPDVTTPIVDGFLSQLTSEKRPEFVGIIGYCFGAKYAIQQLAKGKYATVGAIAHPSFVTMEEVAAIDKPIIISAAEIDPIFPEELRHQTETKLREIGARYQLTLFSHVSHGFAVRHDTSDPIIKYAMDKTLADQIQWFNLF
jgi:dienelactone hydrolase